VDGSIAANARSASGRQNDCLVDVNQPTTSARPSSYSGRSR